MSTYTRRRLTIVWAVLLVITAASWLTARGGGSEHVVNPVVTVVVVAIAAVKAHLVIWHFMDVRTAPRWLKACTGTWTVAIFALLLGFYWAAA
ncbi:cytochrome C oxidase subunit IV family protein [Mycolicibacterium sediminis]|uniref:cytochrome C oxidase subunit IV family protein n=1 Tax=Mycolicibacterium sediminis TaxID=1286180 RepID=UPI0013D03717|nr:cytochrome C oxidase subunit IV family protein [Mycolicibacterium sediminis]